MNNIRTIKPRITLCVSLGLATLLTACAGSSQKPQTEDSTNLVISDYEVVEEVQRISNYKIDGWQYVDPFSLILPTSPGTEYWVQFKRRCNGLNSTEVIGITSTASSVLSRFDAVIVGNSMSGIETKCYIDKIFKITKKKIDKETPESN